MWVAGGAACKIVMPGSPEMHYNMRVNDRLYAAVAIGASALTVALTVYAVFSLH